MIDARSVASTTYTFDAIDLSMPGTFVVQTITGAMHLVANDSAGESAVRRVWPQDTSEFVGDGDWLPARYHEIRVGEETSFRFIRSETYGESPTHTGTRRRIARVIQISLYDGYPALPDPDTTGRPRGWQISISEEPCEPTGRLLASARTDVAHDQGGDARHLPSAGGDPEPIPESECR